VVTVPGGEVGPSSSRAAKRTKVEPSKARQELLKACEREGARATEEADAAALVASEGLWGSLFGAGGEEQATPQAKAMVAVNAMRLDAFHVEAARLEAEEEETQNKKLEGIPAKGTSKGFETRIVSFDSAVSTRNLALMGWPSQSRQ